jgi:hypothetical protein
MNTYVNTGDAIGSQGLHVADSAESFQNTDIGDIRVTEPQVNVESTVRASRVGNTTHLS